LWENLHFAQYRREKGAQAAKKGNFENFEKNVKKSIDEVRRD